MVLRRLSTIAWVWAKQLNSGVTTLILGVPGLFDTGSGLLLPGEEPAQVTGIARFSELRDVCPEAGVVDPALPPCNLLDAGDLQPLAVFDHVDKLGGLKQGVVRPRVQPRRAAPEDLGMQDSGLEVEAVQVRDLELAALRG